jgi:hypothetical protein
MENLIMEIKAISQTLETLDIKPTVMNMDKLLGCQQHLATVAEELEKKAGEQNGNSDPE